ncbi:hypothetical protein GCM10020258_39520 [Sphingomonas yabuuchiae]
MRTGDITVPAMPMDRALDMIGRQSGVNVNFDPDAVKGLTSRPVRGAQSAADAIRTVIGGTSLTVVPAVQGAWSSSTISS